MSRQFRFDFRRPPAFRRETFVVSPSNAAVFGLLEDWRSWPSGALALVGPEGSGKSHLAAIWAAGAGAVRLNGAPASLDGLQGRPVLIESADSFGDDETLFHLINMAAAGAGAGLLLTSRLAPWAWPASLPDLRSRLNALPVAELGEPDDAALAGVLRNLLAERNIVPAPDLIPYLLTRMERSFARAREIADRLDELSQERGREVNKSLALEALEVDKAINDLFG